MEALYVPAGDAYEATDYTRGPWDPGFQHAGPPSALLARAAASVSGIPEGHFARATFDILRPVPIAAVRARAQVLRPGRRVEQLEAVLTAAGDEEPLMRMFAWRIREERETLPERLAAEPPPRGPDGLEEAALPFFRDEVAYHTALDWRLISGSTAELGPAAVWTRLRIPLIAGLEAAPLERLLVMADAASGVSATLDWQRFTFLNVDFGVHLERPPEGEWMAMDAVTRPGTHGAGQCVATLSDARGRIGVSTQSLLIASR